MAEFDLNLSTQEGMRTATERLRKMAERLCDEPAARRGLPRQPSFNACVDSTLMAALRQTHAATFNTVTRAANVSLADLDLSTPEGLRRARERLRAIARHVCAELAHSRDLSYRPNFGACVDDTVANALAQVNALAAVRDSRLARK